MAAEGSDKGKLEQRPISIFIGRRSAPPPALEGVATASGFACERTSGMK